MYWNSLLFGLILQSTSESTMYSSDAKKEDEKGDQWACWPYITHDNGWKTKITYLELFGLFWMHMIFICEQHLTDVANIC